jgi:hypothetical protein
VKRVFISYRTSDYPDLVGLLDEDLARAVGQALLSSSQKEYEYQA